MRNRRLIILYCIALSSCASGNRLTNLATIEYLSKPILNTYFEPDVDFRKYRYFSVIPYSSLAKNSQLNPIAEHQMMFFLRGIIEGRGYQYVKNTDSADFVIALDASNDYKETYIPQRLISVPTYVPSRTVTIDGSTTGTANANASDGSYASGDYREKTSAEVTTPGYMTSRTETTGGYSVGHYYPQVTLLAYETKSNRNILQAVGGAVSKTQDVRVACQSLVAGCLRDVPQSSIDWNVPPQKSGIAGLRLSLLTIDGNTYWPAVTSVAPDLGADEAGLEYGDFVIMMDGRELKNKPVVDVYKLLQSERGTQHAPTIFRLGRYIQTTLTMSDRAKVKN